MRAALPAEPPIVEAFSPGGRWTDLFRGAALPFAALGLIFRSRKLALLSLASSAVTFVALAGLVVLLSSYTGSWVGAFWERPEAWYVVWLWYLVVALAFLVLLVVGANTVPLLLLAPLQDPISEATEELCGDFTAPPFSAGGLARSAALSIAHTAKRIAWLLGGHALLLPLNFIPAVGSVAWSVLGALWTMSWLAGEYLSGVMARHLYPFRDVRRTLWRRKALALGFGAAVYVILWVPVLNFFFIPLAIVGGTLLFRGLRAAGEIPPRDLP